MDCELYLIVDIGNTLAKFFLYNEDQWVLQEKVKLDLFVDKAEAIIADYPNIKAVIYTDVSHTVGTFFEKYSDSFPVL